MLLRRSPLGGEWVCNTCRQAWKRSFERFSCSSTGTLYILNWPQCGRVYTQKVGEITIHNYKPTMLRTSVKRIRWFPRCIAASTEWCNLSLYACATASSCMVGSNCGSYSIPLVDQKRHKSQCRNPFSWPDRRWSDSRVGFRIDITNSDSAFPEAQLNLSIIRHD